jgi:hypothetical protein
VQQHAGKRINAIGVKATGHHDQIGLEALQRGDDQLVEGVQIGVVPTARG